ncbi:MAG: cytochrome c peroxidase [Pirellulaceae bacterium]
MNTKRSTFRRIRSQASKSLRRSKACLGLLVGTLILGALDCAFAQDSYQEYSASAYAESVTAESQLSPSKSGEQYDEYHSSDLPDAYSDPDEVYARIQTYSRYGTAYSEQKLSSQIYYPEYDEEGAYRQPTDICFVDQQLAVISTSKTGQLFGLSPSDGSVVELYRDPQANFGRIENLSDNFIAVVEQHRGQVLIFEIKDPSRSSSYEGSNEVRKNSQPTHSEGTQAVSGKETSSRRLSLRKVLSAPGAPTALAWSPESGELWVSGCWSQRLYKWQLSLEPSNVSVNSSLAVDLPMCGGELIVLPKHDVVMVADAFGRDFVMVDRGSSAVIQHDKLYGHNIAALRVTEDEEFVFFPHQLLNEFARSVTTDITWGGLMSNNLRWLRVDRLLHEDGEKIFKKGKFYPLGTPGNGAGDPSSLAVSVTGRLAVTLAGTNRVAIGNEEDYYFRQFDVGYRPVDCEFSPNGKSLWVVNQFSDSLTQVDLEGFEVRHFSLGALRPPSSAERGERLFFSSRLGHDGWMSCHSCHSQGHTNGQLNDNFTDHTFGTPKRILSLLGQGDTAPYAWDGGMESLRDQVGHSIVSTMAGAEPPASAVDDISAFVAGLKPPPSVVDARQTVYFAGGSESVDETGAVAHNLGATLASNQHPGALLFRSLGCVDCHAGSVFTSPATFDVGMADEENQRLFNPPSLRSVSQRATALFHDASAASLRDVVETQRHQIDHALSEAEIETLLSFLNSL